MDDGIRLPPGIDDFIKEVAIENNKRFAKGYLEYLFNEKIITEEQKNRELNKINFLVDELTNSSTKNLIKN